MIWLLLEATDTSAGYFVPENSPKICSMMGKAHVSQ
jgi:hypothetical protein